MAKNLRGDQEMFHSSQEKGKGGLFWCWQGTQVLHWKTSLLQGWTEVISSTVSVWCPSDLLCATVGGKEWYRVWWCQSSSTMQTLCQELMCLRRSSLSTGFPNHVIDHDYHITPPLCMIMIIFLFPQVCLAHWVWHICLQVCSVHINKAHDFNFIVIWLFKRIPSGDNFTTAESIHKKHIL